MSSWGFNLLQLLWTFSMACLVYSGDPCPHESQLPACTCFHQEFSQAFRTKLSHATTPLPNILSAKYHPSIKDVMHNNEFDTPSSWETTRNANASLYTYVSCESPDSISVLEESVKNGLHRKSVNWLSIAGIPPEAEHQFVHLPGSWLKYIRVKQFEIHNTTLSGDFLSYGNPFEGQERSLMALYINNCYLSGSLSFDTSGTIRTKGLNTLKHLGAISFSHNQLVYLTSTAFKLAPTNLSYISISYNNIQGIEAGVFSSVPNLRVVDLSHNLVETVSRSFFSTSAKALHEIDFSWNNIKVIPVDMFSKMPALKIVNFSHNFLHSLTEKPWSSVWKQLEFIDLRGNYLHCDCDLLWVLNQSTTNATTTTPAPASLQHPRVLGSCDSPDPIIAATYQLSHLTKNDVYCDM